jgi:hypothetical protein
VTLPGVLSVAAGVILLGAVSIDVFSTVLHPWGKSGRLGRWVVHAVWRAALHASRPLRQPRRHRLLSLVGPMLIPLVVGLWAALAVAGFALLYLPAMPAGTARWEGLPPATTFIDAFYLSGYTFFTLGFGDIVPTGTAIRILTILQSGSGFAFITFVISYFFSVYGAYTHKTVLAESLYFQAARSARASILLAGHLRPGSTGDTLASEVGRIRDGVVRLRAEYSNYPILHFFRDQRPEQSALRLLFVAQDMAALMDTVIQGGAAGLGERAGLGPAAAAAQRALVQDLLWQVGDEVEAARDEPTPTGTWERELDHHLENLAEAGVEIDRSEGARRAYLERRGSWEPLLRLCARTLGAEWEEVSGSRDSAPPR